MKRRTITCNNCGACCQYVGYPMGFAFLVRPLDIVDDPANIEIARGIPPEARKIYVQTKELIERGEYDEDGPCCWLTADGQQCQFHAHRPVVCREFRIGGKACLRIRRERLKEQGSPGQ